VKTGKKIDLQSLTADSVRDCNQSDLDTVFAFLAKHNSVEELFFSSYWNLSVSEIPRSVGGLTSLVKLKFVGNVVREIPPEIGLLCNLEELCVKDPS
jgi:Leucine-rich repeat (LRR) protein